MQKAIKLPNYPLPYVVFLCKVFEHYKVDFFGEASYTRNHTSLIGANALRHMGMAFRGNIWCFKDEPDAKPADNAEPSSAASQTLYKQEMLRMVTTLLDHHHTWMSKLDSIEHQLSSIQVQLALVNTGHDPSNPEAIVDSVEGSESEQFEDATNDE
ncbi:hypothetical protein DEO72_LG1g2783 [Vigna unguiculata]|uniref:Uncharacterized protein n=1 Tax=Vigna unguiculata TaxID=3917 RepID=A0A4D6KYW7_VIGUN|nr:hypothetical protein DEO72_LG1g2783 [Vigna unguiculata]